MSTGTVSLILYFIDNIFAALLLFFIGTAFVLIYVLILVNQRKIGLYFGLFVFLIVGEDQLLKSEILKDKIILSAILKDDRSIIKIILQKNGKFEVLSGYMFRENIFKGNYKLIDNKIIFLDKHYDNNFIPDTVYIIQDKIIMKFDKNGKPTTNFAQYFQIQTNELNKAN